MPRLSTWSLWLPFLLACSRLPDFAAPRNVETGRTDITQGDVIFYRKLERSDFKAKSPQGVAKQGNLELGAQTCASLGSNKDVRIDLLQITAQSGQVHYEGRVGNLRFYAVMDRECSWWNPNNDDLAYTLEHEQVHFAISELAARQLNREAATSILKTKYKAQTKEALIKEVEEDVKELLDEHNEAALERNHDFDEDTSVGRDPPRQRAWRVRIERELEETKAWK